MNEIKRLFIGIFSLLLGLDLIISVKADLAPSPSNPNFYTSNPIILVSSLVIIVIIIYFLIRRMRKKNK